MKDEGFKTRPIYTNYIFSGHFVEKVGEKYRNMHTKVKKVVGQFDTAP